MMRNMRNFFIDLSVDGRASDIHTGPKSKDGGLNFRMTQNDSGEVKEVLRVYSTAHEDGSLVTTVWVNGQTYCIETKR